uniref:Piwi domain-containing protein n=1 Tax=Strigamia maritima TaxID=126957 RepID=T1J398_STRMM
MLVEFKDATKFKPDRIIFYRDGVGEGQFCEILSKEVVAIRAACKSLGNYQPLITFLVVQKRHNTRLFCGKKTDTTGRCKNIPSGTVVDNIIIHPSETDFYLCSHEGKKGTSRPTHYHVIFSKRFTTTNL